MKIKISRKEWNELSKTASSDYESLKSNKYFLNPSLYNNDSASISLNLTIAGSNAGFISDVFYIGGLDLVQNAVDGILKNFPSSENGNVTFAIDYFSHKDSSIINSHKWKTHLIYYKRFGFEKILKVIIDACNKSIELDNEYNEYEKYQRQLIDEKESRKSGYARFERKSPKDKSLDRMKKKEDKLKSFLDKQEEKNIENSYMEKSKGINTPFESIAVIKDNKIKMSKGQWQSIGKQAGWDNQVHIEEVEEGLESWQSKKIEEYILGLREKATETSKDIMIADNAWKNGDIEFFKALGVI